MKKGYLCSFLVENRKYFVQFFKKSCYRKLVRYAHVVPPNRIALTFLLAFSEIIPISVFFYLREKFMTI